MIKTKHPLRLWRNARQMTAAELAVKVGIHESYLSVIETGRRRASADVKRRLSYVTGVPIKQMVAFEPAP